VGLALVISHVRNLGWKFPRILILYHMVYSLFSLELFKINPL